MAETCNPIGEWITTAEAADLTGYHVKYVRRLVKEGRIAGRKRGRDWWVDKASVRACTSETKRLRSSKHDPWRAGARCKSAGAE